jgi:hypothetical protein
MEDSWTQGDDLLSDVIRSNADQSDIPLSTEPLAPEQLCQNCAASHLHLDQLGLGAGTRIGILRQKLASLSPACGLRSHVSPWFI